MFDNLDDNYSEIVAALFAHRDPVSYFELHNLLESHEICLTAKQSVACHLVPAANIFHASTPIKDKGTTFSQNDSIFWSFRGRDQGKGHN